jgi:hypothetical protein
VVGTTSDVVGTTSDVVGTTSDVVGNTAQSTSKIIYKLDNIYDKSSYRGIRYDDESLDIDWCLKDDPIMSEQDLALPKLSKAEVFE